MNFNSGAQTEAGLISETFLRALTLSCGRLRPRRSRTMHLFYHTLLGSHFQICFRLTYFASQTFATNWLAYASQFLAKLLMTAESAWRTSMSIISVVKKLLSPIVDLQICITTFWLLEAEVDEVAPRLSLSTHLQSAFTEVAFSSISFENTLLSNDSRRIKKNKLSFSVSSSFFYTLLNSSISINNFLFYICFVDCRATLCTILEAAY